MQRPSEGIGIHQIRFAPGLRPGPRWKAHDAPPQTPSRMERVTPPHTPSPRRIRRLDLGACWFAPQLIFRSRAHGRR